MSCECGGKRLSKGMRTAHAGARPRRALVAQGLPCRPRVVYRLRQAKSGPAPAAIRRGHRGTPAATLYERCIQRRGQQRRWGTSRARLTTSLAEPGTLYWARVEKATRSSDCGTAVYWLSRPSGCRRQHTRCDLLSFACPRVAASRQRVAVRSRSRTRSDRCCATRLASGDATTGQRARSRGLPARVNTSKQQPASMCGLLRAAPSG